ncbi:MAG: DsrE family protein [Gammaproteobacteria bacterium]|nr:DsrE family protein [Gammaproteobacteria bacterium]MCY4277415.1 DsrE family protein [Gammaproteobacteria bacterium]
MNFAIVIEGDPQRDKSLAHAYEFARAAIAAGHRIHRAFLYHDAVRIADRGFNDNILVDHWIKFAREHSFELAACVSAVARRGIAAADGTSRDGIAIVGLGQFADCLLQADRTVTFRA